jgi:HNH endonuclease/NUMOD4 motif-containing protein
VTETWKIVVRNPLYEVSDHGRVRRAIAGQGTWAGRVLSGHANAKGYIYVDLYEDDSRKRAYVHDLVCEAFHGPRPAGFTVAHYDGVTRNNAASNLSWKTYSDNHMDKLRHGTLRYGERHQNAKLTEQDVHAIRARLRSGEAKVSIAEDFGISDATVYDIEKRRRWKRLEDQL